MRGKIPLALAANDRYLYVGGNISSNVYDWDGAGSADATNGENLFRVDIDTGEIDQTGAFANGMANGQVNDLLVDGSMLYVAGDFSGVAGCLGSSSARLCRISLKSPPTVDESYTPELNGQATRIVPYGKRLFVGGDFSELGDNDQSVSRIGLLDGLTAVMDFLGSTGLGLDIGPNVLAVVGDTLFLGGAWLQYDDGAGTHNGRFLAVSAKTGRMVAEGIFPAGFVLAIEVVRR